MTNVLHAHGTETIWSLTDGRLSAGGQIVQEDARKVMFLEATDGVAMISYAGLGATALKTEPSDWMGKVLRGRKYPLEDSLGVIAGAMERQLPRHVVSLATPAHLVVVSAFLYDDVRPRAYTISLCLSADQKWCIDYTRQLTKFGKAPGLILTGSGSRYLDHEQKQWRPGLHTLIRAHDRGRVSALAVADYLANLNNQISLNLRDLNDTEGSVGPRCVVTWRHRILGIYGGGGSQQFYNGTARECGTKTLSTIVTGRDLNAIMSVIMPDPIGMLESMLKPNDLSLFQPDMEEINAKLARLPNHPDENLR